MRERFIHLWIGSKDLSAAETHFGLSVLVDRNEPRLRALKDGWLLVLKNLEDKSLLSGRWT